MDEAALFKFGKWIDQVEVLPRVKKFPRKGSGLGHVTVFFNLKPPSIFMGWMKLRPLNLANASTTASSTPGETIPSRNGCGRDRFLNCQGYVPLTLDVMRVAFKVPLAFHTPL